MGRMSSPQISKGVVHIHCATHNPVEKFSHSSYLWSPLACPLIFFLSSTHNSIHLLAHLFILSSHPYICPSRSIPSEPIHSVRANPFHLSQSIHPPKSLHLSPVYPSIHLSHSLIHLSLYLISS